MKTSIHSAIHTYAKDSGGAMTHSVEAAFDYGGNYGATGEVIQLKGWPTPAMRQMLDGAGNPMARFVGTDERGDIILTTH